MREKERRDGAPRARVKVRRGRKKADDSRGVEVGHRRPAAGGQKAKASQ